MIDPHAPLHVPVSPTGAEVTLKVTAFEVPPPSGGLVTTTTKPPGVARSEELTMMVSWLLLTKVEVCGAPLKVTVEEGMKPPPLMVSVNELEPAGAELGDRLVMDGSGFGVTADWTAMGTLLDATPPMGIATGTALPVRVPAGT